MKLFSAHTSDEGVLRSRVRQFMQMHRAGYHNKIIGRRCHMDVRKAIELAERFEMPWEGKPLRKRSKNEEKPCITN